MVEKIIPYLLPRGDFCADGSSRGPSLNQKRVCGDLGYRWIRVGGFQRLPEQVEDTWADLPVEERGTLITVGVFINFLLLTLLYSPP